MTGSSLLAHSDGVELHGRRRGVGGNWCARLFRHLTLTADGERLGAAARAIRRKATYECS